MTTHGEPVLCLDNKHRRPYEGILIGRRKAPTPSIPSGAVTGAKAAPTETGQSRKLIVSVPSQHSRKPSIMGLLTEEYFQDVQTSVSSQDEPSPTKVTVQKIPRRLELFARTLEEGVLSWGNEPFKYQYYGRGPSPLVQDGYLVPSTATDAASNNSL